MSLKYKYLNLKNHKVNVEDYGQLRTKIFQIFYKTFLNANLEQDETINY